VRSYLIHRLSPLGADAGAIIRRLDEEPDVTIRRALLLSLGEFGEEGLSPAARSTLVPRVQALYRTDADPGLHGASEWLLRRWQEEDWLKQVNEEWAKNTEGRDQRLGGIRRLVQKDREKAPPQWYVNDQDQTMVVIPGPVEFRMGSPAAEEGRPPGETQHRRRIGRSFALAAKAVTVREFRRFLRDNKLEGWFEGGGQAAPLMKKYSPDEDGPIILVDWYTAAAYCNWLSRRDGIPEDQWCYETNADKLSREKVSVFATLLLPHHPLAGAASASYLLLDRRPQVTAMRKNYLGLRGYRLPTEAETEYACRAGAVTSRHYGEAEGLLAEYGWYLQNSGGRVRPVGRKKPNDLGLFDMHGNVWNWCQDRFEDYPDPKRYEAIEDIEYKEDFVSILSGTHRVLRGGSFVLQASLVRCASRDGIAPAYRNLTVGFRPARTLTP
jgi:formylglycine-generating enzyme required for sulfatase activity